jgi:hypothetical protein
LHTIVFSIEVVMLQATSDDRKLQVTSTRGSVNKTKATRLSYLFSKSAFPVTCPHILIAYACIMSSELDSWFCLTLVDAVLIGRRHKTCLAIKCGIETMCPAVTMIPIKASPHWEVFVL